MLYPQRREQRRIRVMTPRQAPPAREKMCASAALVAVAFQVARSAPTVKVPAWLFRGSAAVEREREAIARGSLVPVALLPTGSRQAARLCQLLQGLAGAIDRLSKRSQAGSIR